MEKMYEISEKMDEKKLGLEKSLEEGRSRRQGCY